MKISFDIPAERIANMMISAMESGDPVTTAARGGWCVSIDLIGKYTGKGWWYADPTIYEAGHRMKIVELDDEATGHKTVHVIGKPQIIKGLETMAQKFPRAFAQILADDTDAPCADLFLQSVLFGEEKYA